MCREGKRFSRCILISCVTFADLYTSERWCIILCLIFLYRAVYCLVTIWFIGELLFIEVVVFEELDTVIESTTAGGTSAPSFSNTSTIVHSMSQPEPLPATAHDLLGLDSHAVDAWSNAHNQVTFVRFNGRCLLPSSYVQRKLLFNWKRKIALFPHFAHKILPLVVIKCLDVVTSN